MLIVLTMGAASSLLFAVPFVILLISLASWFAFLIWRGMRMSRAAMLRSDRRYDRETKYCLPAEYHSTESATAIRQRKRFARKNDERRR
jgi:hypothetical protein